MSVQARKDTTKRRRWQTRDRAYRNEQNRRRRYNTARRFFNFLAGR